MYLVKCRMNDVPANVNGSVLLSFRSGLPSYRFQLAPANLRVMGSASYHVDQLWKTARDKLASFCPETRKS